MGAPSEVHRYRAKLAWTGVTRGPASAYEAYSRDYTAEVEGKPPLRGTADPAFRGDPRLHNPEELLVVALSACHMLSFLAIAARKRVLVVGYEDQVVGTMAVKDGGLRFTDVLLRPRVTLAPGGDASVAQGLHPKAHDLCFIANSVNFPVRHEATTAVAP